MGGMLVAISLGAIALLAILHLFLYWTHDASEPPIAHTLIPFLGHIAGFAKKKSRYYVELRSVNHHSNLIPAHVTYY